MSVQINERVALYPTEARKVMEIPLHARIFFLVGDILFVSSACVTLYSLKDTVTESMKLRWTALVVGLTASIHLPILLRAWVFRMFDARDVLFKAELVIDIESLAESNQLMGSVLASAAATSLCVVVSLTALWAVDFFPSLRYSDTLRLTSKILLLLAVGCGELFFVASIIEYQSSQSVVSGIALLSVSLLLGMLGYLPARYYSLFQDELEEEIPFFAG
jgi:hypothetical protein